MSGRDLIFFSYSHADEEWLGRLRIFFKAFPWGVPYKQGGRLWADPYIRTGDVWRREIDHGLARARIGVMLVSPDFLASDFIRNVELPALLDAASSGELIPVCIPVRSSLVDLAQPVLMDYQWPHPPKQPLAGLRSAKRDEALARVVREIHSLAEAEALLDQPTVEREGALTLSATRGLAPPAPVLRSAAGALGRLFGVPEQRPHFVPRPELRSQIREALLSGSHEAVGLTGPRRVGVFGQGGLGKTVAAIDLVHDEGVRRSFPDGIYWLTLRQTPDLVALQSTLIQQLAGSNHVLVASVQDGRAKLRDLLADRACLLVLDDVWRLEHARAFDVAGPRSRLLTTTRDASINTALGADSIELELLEEGQALQVLAGWSGRAVEELEAEARELVRRCGYLPLAVSVAGALVRDGVSWSDLLAALAEGNLRFLDHPYASVFTTLRLSLDALPEHQRERYLELAVAPEDVALPVSVVSRLWGHTADLSDLESRRLLAELQSKSLLYLEGEGSAAQVRFHDLQRDFLSLAAEDLTGLHRRLLASWEALLDEAPSSTHRAWWTLPQSDEYPWQQLAHHLVQADCVGELRALLLDYRWIAGKLRSHGLVLLLADYGFLRGDPITDQLQGALRLSAYALRSDPDQLPGQLTGRLLTAPEPEIAGLLDQAVQCAETAWLRPLTGSLSAPGGALLNTLQGHGRAVEGVAVTLDGKRAISAANGFLQVWNLDHGDLLHTMEVRLASTVAVTPDSKRVVSAGIGEIQVWDLDSGDLLITVEEHAGWVTSVAVTPDGNRAVSAANDGPLDGDGTIAVWDLDSGDLLNTLQAHRNRLNSVAVTPDGMRIVSAGGDGTLQVWGLDSGNLLSTLQSHSNGVNSVAVTPDGMRIVSAGGDGTLKVWDLDRGHLLITLEGHAGRVNSVAVTPDGDGAVSATDNGILQVWDLDSGDLLNTLSAGSNVNSVAVTPDGKRAVSAADDGTLKVWSLHRENLLNGLQRHSGRVNSVAVSPNGKKAVSATDDGTLKVWNVNSGDLLNTLQGHSGRVNSVAMTLDGIKAVSTADDGTLKVWDVDSGNLLNTLRHSGKVKSVAVTPDGSKAVSAADDGTLKVWDVDSGNLLNTLRHSTVVSVTVTPDGKRAVSAAVDPPLKVWDLDTGNLLTTMLHNDDLLSLLSTTSALLEKRSGRSSRSNSVAVTPDGRRAVSAADHGNIKVWNLNTGDLLNTLPERSGRVKGVALTPDGNRIVSAADNGNLELWNLGSGRCIATYTGDAAMTACAALSGSAFIAGDFLGHLHFLKLM